MSSDRFTALHYYASAGKYFQVQALVNEGVDLNRKNSSGEIPLLLAAKRAHREVVELLINSGADIHCWDNDGWTLLHYASKNKWVEIVQYLVNKEVDLDLKTFNGLTSLMVAALFKKRENVELLINSGADINCFDDRGYTILHIVIMREMVDIVQCLVNKGVALNMTNTDGDTPLHLAARYSIFEIVDLIVEAGADCNIENNMGDSPFNLLIEKNSDFESFKLCIEKGAFENSHVESIKLCIEKGAFVKLADYSKMLENPLLQKAILQDVKICSQAVINKFNNKDLPLVYKGLASSQRLPHIDKMKIKSGMAVDVEQSVTREILEKGYCNLLDIVPLRLSILCVKSAVESLRPSLNQENLSKSPKSHKGLKRFNPYKKLCVSSG